MRALYYNVLLFFITLLCTAAQLEAQTTYTLNQALKTARTQNPELKEQKYEIDFAEADLKTEKLHINPTFEFEPVQIVRNVDFEDGTEWHDAQNREVFYEISKPFKWFGQRKNAIGVAEKNLDQSKTDFEETERHILYEVAQNWLEVWEAQKQLEIIETAKNNVDSLAQINQRRFEHEVISETDLSRTKLLAKQYTIQYETAANEFNNSKKELAKLIGSDKPIEIDPSTDFSYEVLETKDSLINQALDTRSDMRSVKHAIDMNESNIKLQKSLSVPQPEVGVIYNPMGSVPFMGLSLAIDLPFFDRNQGEIQKSRQQKEQAESELDNARRTIETEIEIAHSKFKTQKQNLKGSEELIDQAETILENIKKTYLSGNTTIIDFLEAQRSWLEAQQQYYEVKQDYLESQIQLLYSAGLINQLAL